MKRSDSEWFLAGASGALAAVLLAAAASPGRAATCDAGLALADTDAAHGAAAIDLCSASNGSTPGLVSAEYGTADFSSALDQVTSGTAGVGLLAAFGPNVAPQSGARMLALSSGAARSASDPGFQSPTGFAKGYSTPAPPGFPADVAGCPSSSGTVYDSAGLRVALVAPAWAHSYSFDFRAYSTDYPNFLCSAYNDQFVVIASPAPPGSIGGNIAFAASGDPITVNAASFFQSCADGGPYPCPSGPSALQGTGFEGGAATDWLRTSAPVQPGGSVTLSFTVWDAGDGTLDTTVLLDAFRWSTVTVAGPSTLPVPVPEPGGEALAASALGALAWAERRRKRAPRFQR